MPTEIIADPSAYSGPLIAPDGDDFMDDAADIVQAFVQVLADRISYVRDRVVRIDIPSTIAAFGSLTINPTSNAYPAIKCTRAPGQDGSAGPWRQILDFQLDETGGRTVTLYYGNDDSLGSFAIVVNAHWAVDHWSRQNAAKTALALFVSPSETRFTIKPTGAATWTTWPTNLGDIRAGGDLLGGAQLVVASHIVGGGEVRFPGSAVSGGEYRYTASVPRTSIVPIGRPCCGTYTRTATGSIKSPSGDDVAWLIRVPRDGRFGSIEIMHTKTNTNTTTFSLRSRVGTWAGTIAAPTSSDVVTPVTVTASGLQVTPINASSLTDLPNDTSELEIVWHRATSAADDEVHGLRMVDWGDHGPRGEVL